MRKRYIIAGVTCLILATTIAVGTRLVIREHNTRVAESFGPNIKGMCFEDFGETQSALNAMHKVLKNEDLTAPYEIYDNNYKNSSMSLEFDILDNTYHLLHVNVKHDSSGYTVNTSYTTPEECKQEITRVLKEMVGDDVNCRIEETYKDYTNVEAQGIKYRWKNGVLEKQH